jgi:hypothetical protein
MPSFYEEVAEGAADGVTEGADDGVAECATVGFVGIVTPSIVAFWTLHDVCAKTPPTSEDPVLSKTLVLTKRIPRISAPALTLILPATCQKTFFASAPPVKNTDTLTACNS